MAQTYLVSTLVMGAFLALVVGYVARATAWHRWLPSGSTLPQSYRGSFGSGDPESTASMWWAIGSIVGILALGIGISVGITGSFDGVSLFIGFLVGMLGIYVVWGAYHIARVRQMKFAQSVGIGIWFLGLLLLLGIVAKLMAGG